jgi:predicted  nucleic acid-binding Zn-ribbon protein
MEELKSLADLLDLQDVDLQIDRLLHQRQSLPELDDYRAAHKLLTGIATEHEAASAELRQTELDLDRTNGELELTEQKLEAEQNRLYAGGMSARDADYLRREVEMLGRKKGEQEDRVLELMEQRDLHNAHESELAERRATAEAEKSRLEALIQQAWKGIDAEIARKEARKADIVPLVDESLLGLYDELRPIKDGGVAVARLAEGVCGACHLTLTAAEQLEAKRSDPPRCIHCRCILVP